MVSRKMLVLLLVLGLSALAQGAPTWFGGWVNSDFMEGGNWTAGLPGPSSEAIINSGLTAQIDATPENYTVNSVVLGDSVANVNTLIVNGGTLAATTNVIVGGLWTAGQGVLTMNDGWMGSNVFYVGHHDNGAIHMAGGELNPWGLLQLGGDGGIGTVNVDGGLIHCSDLTIMVGSLVTVSDGVLDVESNWTDTSGKVAGYLAADLIVPAAGYELDVQTYTNQASGLTGTRISAHVVPEPACLALLSLGGLLRLRRRTC